MTERPAPRASAIAFALVFPAVCVGVAQLVMPRLRTSIAVAEAATYVGATSVAILGVALGARLPIARRAVIAIASVSICVLVALAVTRVQAGWTVPLVDASLIAIAWSLGGVIGRNVQHPGHLLPAAVVAASADVVSVFSSYGPSRAIASSERALSLLAISFPIPGTRFSAPALGVGDLVFVSLVLGAASAHQLPYRRAAISSLIGMFVAGAISGALRLPIPALPLIGAAVVIGIPSTRRVRRADRTATTIAIGVGAVVAAYAIVSAILRVRR